MFPDKCSVAHKGRQCVSPPEFIVSIVADKDEYMFGLTCMTHKVVVSERINFLQAQDRIPHGKINFSPVKPVGTDCIHGDADDLVEIQELKKLK